MKKILTIATNANPVIAKGKKTGLWLSELTHFVHEVSLAGYSVDVASPKGGKIPLDESSTSKSQMKDKANIHFLGDEKLKASLDHSIAVADVNVEDYEAIYLAGGHGTMWDFRQSPELQELLTAFDQAGKVLSGVCHGVAGFIDTKDKNGDLLIKGKPVTGFSNFEDTLAGSKKFMPFLLEDELKSNGANYRKNFLPFTSRVEIAGNLITGQNPQSARQVGKAVVKMLG